RHPGIVSIAYLGGHTLEELLDAERAASAEALRLRGRPNATLHLPRVDEEALGQLFMLFQIATVYAGALYDVNPLDQPGVELGKRLTYGLMGREGFERPELAEVDPRWVL
ncbi:MAG: glucose-6-phosphate isomerase, partial [Gemmatimonadetes bacterium]|nr:glucose-6-phosphate isomerase [Gemmatimonadota bacterium]